jgi:hypothetical protein
MLPLLPPDTQILCPTTVEPLLTIPGQSAPRSPATVFNSFPPACSALADAGGDAAWILFIGSNDASHVRQLAAARSPSLENALAQAIASNRSLIVAAQSPLPADLQQQHKAPLLPDPGNAAWWFRRVSGHPAASVLGRNLLQWLQDIGASAEVLQQARQLLRADHRIDSQRMIDLAGKALRDPRSTIASTLRLVQYLEIVNLLAFPA